MTHKHEWVPWYDEPFYFTCKDEDCPRVLPTLEVIQRVNATEELSVERALRMATAIDGLVKLFDGTDGGNGSKALRAYAKEMGKSVAAK